ncbi:MAG TPA: UDP binding domain-containing protein, partial [Polyangiaceae bacterium]|nr:UDP binding domain-containing protein [Polyangiaceae bacterium]
LGASFKADVPSIVESKSVELARVMGQRGMHVWVYDPVADFSRCAAPPFEVCTSAAELPEQWDVLILAVAHRSITERSLSAWCTQLRAGGLVVDLTQRWDAAEVRRLGYRFWRL